MNTIEGSLVGPKPLSVVEGGETAVFAARPHYVKVGAGSPWSNAILLLTERRLVITRERLFGKARADFALPWAQVERVDGTLWNGVGPQVQLSISTAATVQDVELIVNVLHAVDVESAIRAAYLDARD